MGEQGRSKRLRVLVAEDDVQIRSLLVAHLRENGYEVLEAGDGVSAYELAVKERPDLVVLDVMMPEKNGWEVARDLRYREETEDLKILMVTAIGSTINEATSPIYGADDYLDKPFDFDALDAKLTALLG